jgi:hypothetical protein
MFNYTLYYDLAADARSPGKQTGLFSRVVLLTAYILKQSTPGSYFRQGKGAGEIESMNIRQNRSIPGEIGRIDEN